MSVIKASEFNGDVLNVVPIQDNLNASTIILPWHCDTSFDLMKNMPTDKSIKLYSNIKTHKLLSKDYFDRYQNTLNKSVNGDGITCATVINSTFSHITIEYVNNEYNMQNRLKSILSTCDVYAIPVIRTSSFMIGNMSYGEKCGYKIQDVDHIILCLGKVNNKYLII